MKLSKYILRIPMDNDDYVIYFNKANGSIILVSRLADKLVLKEQYQELNPDEFENLKRCEMLVEFDKPLTLNSHCTDFQVTIEMSSYCNLGCTYCYQNDKGMRKEISDETLDKVIQYIQKVLQQPEIESVYVGFIGGEPLLHKQKIIATIDRLDEICHLENKRYHIHIDTNGTIAFEDLLEKYKNITIAITLSCHRDHILNRPSPEFDSFQRVVSNIQKCGYPLHVKENAIILRYNTHSENINEFEDFVKMVHDILPVCKIIEPMYTDSYEYNKEFHSSLSKNDFAVWNATKAIDILIKYDFPIKYAVNSGLSTCIAYKPYSCKIYADGIITICDSMFHSEGYSYIDEIYKSPKKLNELLKAYKDYNPLEDLMCKECTDVVLCMGHLLCRNNCDYQVRFHNKEFILSYVKYVLKGKKEMFINM